MAKKNTVNTITILALMYIMAFCWSGSLLRANSADFTSSSASVKSFGATGNGTTDDTSAITSAINWSKANKYKTLFFPNGTYKVSSALPTLNSSYSVVSLVGENPNQTIISSSAPANTIVLSTYGGSGFVGGAEIRDLAISGTGTQVGIENKGTDGLKIINCQFNNLTIGIRFSNDIGSGTFTEYSVAERCSFFSGCTTPVIFVRGAGDGSFHGCGLQGCTIQGSSSNNTPAIIVGNTGETIDLYNAPMDFQIWTYSPINIISIPTAASVVFTHGTITVENDASTASTICGGPGVLYHAGSLTSWGESAYGTLHLVNAVTIMPNGEIIEDRKTFRVQQTLTQAATEVSAIQASPYGTIVSVVLTGSNYDYRYLLFLNHDGYGNNGYSTILANPRSLNGAGWGAPTFSVDSNGYLHITNSAYLGKSVAAVLVDTPLASPGTWTLSN
jgi:hypothetical protein